MLNTGPHGLSEVLYAFTSAANNNGSAFAGISVNTVWYNTALGIAMLLGRFLPMVFVLGLAGSLAQAADDAGDPRARCRPTAVVRRHAHRRDADRGRAHLLPGARARVRSRKDCTDVPPKSPPRRPNRRRRRTRTRAASKAVCSTRRCSGSHCRTRCASSTRARCDKNPVMFIVEIGAVFTTVVAIATQSLVRLADRRSGCGSPCCSPTSPRRSPRAAARPRPTRCAGRRRTPSLVGWSIRRTSPAPRSPCRRRSCAQGDRGRVRGRRHHSRRRRRHRRHRQRRRERDHR